MEVVGKDITSEAPSCQPCLIDRSIDNTIAKQSWEEDLS